MLTLFTAAFLLGLIFNAAPGPVFAETIRQGVRGGFRGAFGVQAGSLVGDAAWAVIGLTGVGLLLQLESLRLPIGVAGVVYLLWLAVDAWRAANQEFSVAAPAGAPSRRAVRAGITLSLTNPQNLAYWAAIASAMAAVGVDDPGPAHYAVFFAGLMSASLAWAVFCAAVVARLFRDASTGWAKLTYRLCAVTFLALALSSLNELVAERQLRTKATYSPSTGVDWSSRIASSHIASTAKPWRAASVRR